MCAWTRENEISVNNVENSMWFSSFVASAVAVPFGRSRTFCF